MTDYLIIRHGSNACNQPMAPRAPVAVVCYAPSADDAREFAAREIGYAHCYNNQVLEAVAESQCRAAEWNAVIEADALNRHHGVPGCVIDYERLT